MRNCQPTLVLQLYINVFLHLYVCCVNVSGHAQDAQG